MKREFYPDREIVRPQRDLVPGAVQFAMWSSCPCSLRSLVLYVAWFAILSGSLDPFLLRHGPAHENPVRRSVGLDSATLGLDALSALDTLTRMDCWICPGQLLKRSKIRPVTPKKERLTRMKRAFRPGRDKVQLVGPVGVASSLSSSDPSVSLCSSVSFVLWFSMWPDRCA